MKKQYIALILIATFLLFGLIGYVWVSRYQDKGYENANLITPTLARAPTFTPPRSEINKTYNMLLIGYGGAGHSGGGLSDVIIVMHTDLIKRTVTLISVPRDLWVDIPIRSDQSKNFKINAAYAIGGDDRNYGLKEPIYKGEMGAGNMAKKVVSKVTGLTMDSYASVNFDNFKKLIDALGGVEVDVPVAFDDFAYPVKGLENETCGFSPEQILEFHQKYSGYELESKFICRYEHLHFDKGKEKMTGERALKFVRSRHSAQDGGDFARSRRQKVILLGARDKLLSLTAIKKVEEIFAELKGLISTDLNVEGVKSLLTIYGSPKDYKVNFVSLNSDNVLVATKSLDGQFILIPKEGENVWVNVQKYISDQIVTGSP